VDVHQSILLDGKDVKTGSLSVTDKISEPAPGGEKFCNVHTLTNQMSVAGSVELQNSCSNDIPNYEQDCSGITTTYGKPAGIDSTTNFGSVKTEVCGELVLTSMTLDQVFAGNGLTYSYTVVNGGTYDGASPIVAVLNLEDGRHIMLYPGWGARTGQQSLSFGDNVATSTSDSGDVVVDFTIYNADFQGGAQWSSNNQYGNWNYLKASGSSTGGPLPLTGNELVTSVTFMTQAANTGEQDTLNGFTYGSKTLNFNAIISDIPFSIESGKDMAFCLCNSFAQNIVPGIYTITTNVVPI